MASMRSSISPYVLLAGTQMHQHYKDILDRIAEPPKWFDDYGVPRYDDFSPWQLSSIYMDEAALAEITCQSCGHPFTVAVTGRSAKKHLSLGDEILLNHVHYGDPPNIHCCDAGPSMNSNMHRILEYWSRDHEVSIGRASVYRVLGEARA
jgi:hypothetical protein